MELFKRDEIEEEMLLALLLIWKRQREEWGDTEEFWDRKRQEDMEWLLYWLGAVFSASAVQHGVTQSQAEAGAATWATGHSIAVMQQFGRHSKELLTSQKPEENIFGENRAKRFVETEFTAARSTGGEYAKLLLGEHGQDDLWFAANPAERRCPYCGRLHMEPRSRWNEIYYDKILPVNPEFAIYGEPDRPPVHPNCNCFILYSGESDDYTDPS